MFQGTWNIHPRNHSIPVGHSTLSRDHCDSVNCLVKSSTWDNVSYPGPFTNSFCSFFLCAGLGKSGVSSQDMWSKSLIKACVFSNLRVLDQKLEIRDHSSIVFAIHQEVHLSYICCICLNKNNNHTVA